jgi:hypothetical protein
MSSIPHTPRRLPRIAAVAASLAAASLSAIALGAGAPDAHALNVGSGPEGLRMAEPSNTLDRVSLSIVDVNGTPTYRIEMPEFGGRGLVPGANCRPDETEQRPGVNVVLCDRINPKVDVSLGPLGDSFTVDPSFPDPIDIFGGLGSDSLRLGAANDRARGGSGKDTIVGNGGDDDLRGDADDDNLDGGPGNDNLFAIGGFDVMEGGDGDDTLEADPSPSSNTSGRMVGGPGTDVFRGNGSVTTIDSRDGIAEEVSCGLTRRGFSRVHRVFARAEVDLLDQPSDAELLADGCTSVDRAPVNETTAAEVVGRSASLRGGKVQLRVRCTTSRRCTGNASVRIGRQTGRARFSVAGRRTVTVAVSIPRSAARRVTRQGVNATASLTERGVRGQRTDSALLKVRS